MCPLWDIKCIECGDKVEILVSVSEADDFVEQYACQECGGEVDKEIGASSIHFDGSDWAGEDIKKGKD